MYSLPALLLTAFILTVCVSAQSGNVRQDYEIVECFRNQDGCTNRATVPGVMLPAGECCNSSFSATAFILGEDSSGFGIPTCLGCTKVEFNQRSFEFGQEDTGKTYTIMVDATYTAAGSGAIQTPITIMAENIPSNAGDYISRGTESRIATSFPYSFEIQIASIGNQLALEDDLLFNFTMSVNQAPSVFLVLGRTQVKVADLDVVWVELEPQLVPEPSEGSGLPVKITRRTIGLAMSFGVTVTTFPITPRFNLSGPVNDYIATALSTDYVIGEMFTRQITDQINEVTMEFTLETDNIVELDEVFNVTLTVSDHRVIIRGESTKTVEFTSPQVFNIGFKKTRFVITEGESIELEIQEFGDFIGGEVVGGLPEVLLNQSARIINEPTTSPAIVGTDFIFNETIQSFLYGSDNRLQSVAFHPVHSIEDNMLEGDENIRIKLLTNRPIPMQIENSTVQTATVTIKDTTTGSITLEVNDYLFFESQGVVQVCAVIHDAFAGNTLSVPFTVTENTAKEGINEDYRRSNEIAFIFRRPQNRTCIRFLIVDDEIAEPFHESFTVSLTLDIDPPEITSNVNISTIEGTITIQDDDGVRVRFENSSYTFIENGGNQLIYLILEGGMLSTSESVEVFITEPGGSNRSLGFASFDSSTRRASVVFPVTDDTIALQMDRISQLSLRTATGGFITEGSPTTANVTVLDDDDVTVSFVRSSYSYSEDHGTVSNIQLMLSNGIAKDLSVNVTGGPGASQPFVIISGKSVTTTTVTFTAGGSLTQNFPSFDILNDDFGLENIERYNLSLSNPSITEDVHLGPDTAISIIDDDRVSVRFDRQTYSYHENNGTVSDIQIVLSNGIARDFSVDVSGGPGSSQPYVDISGVTIRSTVRFMANGSLTQLLSSFNIMNDDTALEANEMYNLTFSNPSSSDVGLGPDTRIIIADDDAVTVSFVRSSYSYDEDHGTVSNIQLRLNKAIARDLSVDVIGGPRTNQPYVLISGANVSTSITFIANGSMIRDLSSFNIEDDQIGLEDTEEYTLGLFNPSITSNVMLGPDTTISIRDNDDVTVNFVKTLYEYNENDGDVGDIQVQLNRMIARELIVNVSGDPISQEYVVQSGFDVRDDLTFEPFSNTSLRLSIYQITDDNTGLEDVESYNISLALHRGGGLVMLGNDAIIRINDDDVPELHFTEPSYSFIESEGLSHKIIVVLSKPVVRQVTVQVYGEPVDQPGVTNSGSLINQTIVFQPNNDSNLMRLVPVQINDDNVSSEPLQTYPVNFRNVPQGIILAEYNSTNVIIVDDDTSAVHFAVEIQTVSESVGSVNVTVILTGSTAVPVTVDVVLPNDSSILGTAAFQPSSNPIQMVSFIQTINNDNIALEDDNVLVFELRNVTNSRIAEPSLTTLVIQDDDVLVVSFSKPEYRFNEDDESVNIRVNLSHPIARQFTVNTASVGRGGQQFVDTSGPDFSDLLIFQANTDSRQSIPISRFIRNDDIALENIETYEVQFSSPNPSQRVMLGEPTDIYILDEEVVNITFQDGNNFNEGLGSMNIVVNIDKAIIRMLSVMINSTYQPDQFVHQSGSSYSTQVVFMPLAQMTRFFNFPIDNDNAALENTEREILSFTGTNLPSSVSDRAILGPNVVATIEDDDEVEFEFVDNILRVPENSGSVAIRIRRNNPILRSVNITIIGTLIGGQPYIEPSGSPLNRVITFSADDSQDISFNYTIRDDISGLESVEVYSFELNRSEPTTNVNLNNENLMIQITDDDVVSVNFGSPNYTFIESTPLGRYEVVIDRPIVRNLTVGISRGLVYRVDGIKMSSTSVNELVTFTARASRSIQADLNILDDNVALENDEIFPLIFNFSSNSNVILGSHSNVTIKDDDEVVYGFVMSGATLIENGGNRMFIFTSSPTARDVTYTFTPNNIGPQGNVSQSLTQIVCGSNNSVTVPASDGVTVITCMAVVMDDSIALENDETASISVTGPPGSVSTNDTFTVVVQDDDSVSVRFVKQVYSYHENNGTVSDIQIVLSNGIARDFSVDVSGGPGSSQPNVDISGATIHSTVRFMANGSLTQLLSSFNIMNDDTALEANEIYNLTFSNPSSSDVGLGPDTRIIIADDDDVTVSFVQSSYLYSEDHGTVSNIQLRLNKAIARDLSVDVIGGPRTNQLYVLISGANVSTSITFIANGSMIRDLSSFNIEDDQIGLEDTEEYTLGLFNPSVDSNVILGPDTTISIRDNDVVTVNFVKTIYEYNENDSDVGDIQVQLNRMIARELIVNVSGDPISQEYVVQSGFDVRDDLTFEPFSNTSLRLSIYQITDDNTGLEDVESYNISLALHRGGGLVMLGNDAIIRINNDDVPELHFTEPSYNFIESEGLSHKITVVLSKPVVRQVSVQVYGEPVDQPGVTNSGSVINQIVVFQPNNNSNSNLMRLVPVLINDDNVSSEPLQTYPVNFRNVPQGIILAQYNSTNVNIFDDDTSAVRFAVEFLTVSESVGSVNVTVILTGSTAVPVTVDVVLTNDSSILGTATFQPSSNPIQMVSFIQTINNDNIALEDDNVLVFELRNVTNSRIAEPSLTTLVIQDDDVLVVSFSKPEYRFNEDDGSVNIHVNLSHPIARQFTVNTVDVGRGGQQFVNSSGPDFSNVLTFPANTDSRQSLPISRFIRNDDIALENIETYEVQFSSPNPSQRVMLGEPTDIYIFDEEVVNITFRDGNNFNEGLGSMNISVNIDKAIIRMLSVMINSTYQHDQYVRRSGSSYSTQVVFMPLAQMTRFFNFPINNDNAALENTEREILSFTGTNLPSSVSDRAILGPNVVATIEDDDEVEFEFVNNTLRVPENSGSVAIRIRRNNPILRSVNITIIGTLSVIGDQFYVEPSGSPLNRVITFPSDDSQEISFNYTIRDDILGLESVEVYSFELNGSEPTTNVNLNNENLMIQITDDDVVSVNFGSPNYTFIESTPLGRYEVVIDRPIVRNLTVGISRGPVYQPDGIVMSGPSFDEFEVKFTARGSRNVQADLIISDDIVALENDEIFPLNFKFATDAVILGSPSNVTIKDDDEVVYGFVMSGATLIENGGNRMFTFTSSPTARDVTYTFTPNNIGPQTGVSQSLTQIVCGGSNSVTVPAGHNVTVITCVAVVMDDSIALENDETASISVTGPPGSVSTNDTFTVVVQDDDMPEVQMVTSTATVTEGNTVEVCVMANIRSIRQINVVLNATDGSARNGFDYNGGGLRTLVIPANSTGPICTQYDTVNDTVIEGVETFVVTISSADPDVPSPSNPIDISVGDPQSTTVSINEPPQDVRNCELDSTDGTISTFVSKSSYLHNSTCEHYLLTQYTQFGHLDIVVDSLNGSYLNTRLGVRLGMEILVVNAYNQSVIKSERLNLISYTKSDRRQLDISINMLRLSISVTPSGIRLSIERESNLTTHLGLCGDQEGNMRYFNRSLVSDEDIRKAVGQFIVPPSETFVRTITRRHCGLLAEDVESGDPVYTVPLYTPDLPNPHTYSLCYEIHGQANSYINFISDGCTSVNGHYFSVPERDPMSNRASFHAVDRVHILAVDSASTCVKVDVMLDSNNNCVTSVNGVTTTSYKRNWLSVEVNGNDTTITVPNCVDGALTMSVSCKVTRFGIGFQEFRVLRGLNLNEQSHGIIGQFWNIRTKVTKYNETLIDDTIHPNAYRIDVYPPSSDSRSFVGFLEDVTWDFSDQPCIYAGNSQGGPTYEVKDGGPNDGLLEGDVKDYIMDGPYDVLFDYNHFHSSNRCN